MSNLPAAAEASPTPASFASSGSVAAGSSNGAMGSNPQVNALADSTHVRPSMFRAYITVNGGSTTALMEKTQKMTSALKMPNERSGMSGLSAVARNAADVVKDVTKMA